MIPYTYLVVFTHPETNEKQYYYGVQYGRTAKPENLWKTYFTSSRAIHYRRKEYEDSCFQYEIRKIFSNPKQARIWEEKVLKRMKVVVKREWLNKNDSVCPPIYSGDMNPFFGKKHSEETKAKLREKANRNYADPKYKEKILTSAQSRDNSSFKTDEYRAKKAEQSRKNYVEGKTGLTDNRGDNNGMYGKKHSDQTIQIFKDQRKGCYAGDKNPMFGKAHSEEAKAKVSESRKGKIWVNNGFITKSIDEVEFGVYGADGWRRGRAMDKRAGKKYIIDKFLSDERPNPD